MFVPDKYSYFLKYNAQKKSISCTLEFKTHNHEENISIINDFVIGFQPEYHGTEKEKTNL